MSTIYKGVTGRGVVCGYGTVLVNLSENYMEKLEVAGGLCFIPTEKYKSNNLRTQ